MRDAGKKCAAQLLEKIVLHLAAPNPIFCLCSAGMFENLFAPFCKGTVRTEIIQAIGLGDECCEFVVHFDK